jgi:hypothetical protein
VPTPTIPAVMGEGLKPLKVNHRPSESSHRATGTVAIPDHAEICAMTPKNAAMVEAMSRGGSDESHQGDGTRHEA